MTRRWVVGVVVGLVAVTVAGGLILAQRRHSRRPAGTAQPAQRSSPAPSRQPSSAANSSATTTGLPACGDGPLFDHLPMALDDFRAFRPLGFIAIPIHIFGAKHSNFSINLPDEHVSGKRVEFPSNATVTAITSTSGARGSGYQLTFAPCREFKSYFFHLGTISDALQRAFDAATPRCQEFTFDASGPITKCEAALALAVSSGDLVGGSDSFGGVDWGGVDYRVTAQYANSDRYDGDYPHYVSPVSYLRSDLKALMAAKLGSYDGEVPRTAEPRVGQLNEDVPGTAAGNWFIGEQSFKNTQDFSPFLALRHDYVDPTEPLIAMGTSVAGATKGIYSFTVASSGTANRDFRDLKPDGQLYCYDQFTAGRSAGHLPLSTVSGVIVMTMSNATTLQVEHQAGSCREPHVLTAATTTFLR